jgi:hypothetical protein
MNHLKTLRAACAVLALGSTAAIAQEATRAPADMNKDGIVTRTEYMDYMGKMWDDNHATMMKSDKMMKKDSMNAAQYGTYWRKMTLPDGTVDPGKVGGGSGNSGAGGASK